MTRHTRINVIIELLQQESQTVESIAEHFNKALSHRQIRSSIESIKALGYDNESFEKTGAANRKTWQITPNSYELNTQRLNRGVLPQVFALKRYKSVVKLNNWLEEESNPIIDSTHFYETEAHDQLDKGLESVIQAIDNGRKLRLVAMNGDATSVLRLVKFPVLVLPIKILYHRGCFYLAAVADEVQQILTFQIDQLRLEETAELFEPETWIDKVEINLNNRFGITQNINNEEYDITLRFSSITGAFVCRQFWHNTQQEQQDGDDWLVTFHCGINRELVGWLFQWMSNVKVIGPPKLKALYDEQLARMLNVTNQPLNEPLAYTNRFAPKNE